MDPKEEERLLRLLDEVSTDELESSESEPYSSDDDVRDPTYQTSSSEESSKNENQPSTATKSTTNENQDMFHADVFEPESNETLSLSYTEQDVQELDNDTQNLLDMSEGVTDDEWYDITAEIPDFLFDNSQSGLHLSFDKDLPTAKDYFYKFWNQEIMELILDSMNSYMKILTNTNLPKQKYSRHASIRPFSMEELHSFLGICILQGQIKYPSIRKLFSMNPLYYAPVFHYTLSGRRFEDILRCFSCAYSQQINKSDRLNKVRPLLNILLLNFRNAYYPAEQLSLDESLFLFRGRLSFRVYMKGKKSRYGIKFYELCTSDGYVLNMKIYKGKSEEVEGLSKIEALVLELMEPYLDRGHHLFLDNYYNSILLSKSLLERRTHSTGTLRKNRKGNPKALVNYKLKKGEHKWQRKGKIYISMWKDKREVLCITTKYHPKLIQVQNRFGKTVTKPEEVARYNDYMSGIDRCDQMVSYYSSPRKSIRWYKKVMFHLLDVAIWNSFYAMKKHTQNMKLSLLEYRENLVRELLNIPKEMNDGRKIIHGGALHGGKRPRMEASTSVVNTNNEQHFPDNIPNAKDPSKTHHMRCKWCLQNKKRKETKYLCKTCPGKPALCIVPCFEQYHRN